ncbi:beta-ketoacyl synthase N-terminal-like domain-containing protein [Leptolyngbya sp. AN03gr2]
MVKQPTQTESLNGQLQRNPIAIVGIASVFPQAQNLQEYWENILHEVDCITDVPSSRWSVDDYYDPNPRAPDKTYSKRGGFIPDTDFDPMEFGLPPNLLEVTDISQLLSLVVARQAIEDAGYGESRQFDHADTGVILGVAVGRQLAQPFAARLQYPLWERVLKSTGISAEDRQKIIEKLNLAYVQWEENAFPGMLANVVPGRIANRLNLGGTNCAVDAACASSLAALKMALSELVERRCSMMLTGGVDTDNSIFAYLCFSKTPALSRSGQSRPFDINSDGMMLGEGIGMMVLKRLEDAERDGDRIYAVIKGIGSSSDGKFKSIYAPRPEGQVKALERAYADAKIDPATIGLIEAHGTGTMAGDPSELAALNQVFNDRKAKRQSIALGSVKSQIGHTKAAAGAASLIKVALSLHHKILPATLNITAPNPRLDLENSPFYLNTKTRPWIRANGAPPRRAGVSSFGFGGTNYHVVLEEYQPEHEQPYRLHRAPQSLLLFAETREQLLAQCETLLNQLTSEQAEQDYASAIAAARTAEIPAAAARIGFVASSLKEARTKLNTAIQWLQAKTEEAWEHPQGIYYRATSLDLQGRVVALFSGQGSQYLNMGQMIATSFPMMRQTFGDMDQLMTEDGLNPISEVVFPPSVFEDSQRRAQIERLQKTEYAQPAIGSLSAGLYKILQQTGFKPDFVAGHSFGELGALWASGVLTDEDYYCLVKARGQAMAAPAQNEAGAMIAVKGDANRIAEILRLHPQVAISNWNSPQQVVLAGTKAGIAALEKVLQQQNIKTTLLPVSRAFHTPLVAHAQQPFAEAIGAIRFNPPQIPVYTNITGQRYASAPSEIQSTLKQHMVNSVQFQRQIETIYEDGGFCFVEFGPKNVLTNLVKAILEGRPHLAIALNADGRKDSDQQLREAMMQLRVAGLPLKDLDSYEKAYSVQRQKSKLNVRLNCTNYVSEKTREAFECALNDGFQIDTASKKKAEPVEVSSAKKASLAPRVVPIAAVTVTDEKATSNGSNPEPQESSNGHTKNHPALTRASRKNTVHTPVDRAVSVNSASSVDQATGSTELSPSFHTQSQIQSMSDASLDYSRILTSLECSLAQLHQHQNESLQVHQQYLNHQMEYARIFLHLTQQQQNLLLNGDSAVVDSLERSMMQFHHHQAETQRIHEHSLLHQMEYTRGFSQMIQQQYSLLLTGQETTSKRLTARSQLDSSVMPVTASRSDAVPSLNFAIPLPEQAKQISPTLATLAQGSVAPVNRNAARNQSSHNQSSHNQSNYLEHSDSSRAPKNGSGHTGTNGHKTVHNTDPAPLMNEVSQDITPAFEVDRSAISQALLEIVSEKTGYPVEMLEVEMAMEADLGIDSIKRVEILGALQERFPDAPNPNPEDLIELLTLGQIIDAMQKLATQLPSKPELIQPASASDLPVMNSDQSDQMEPEPRFEEVAINIVDRPLASVETATVVGIDPLELQTALLEIVSEKTGYPVEMLEVEMAMEADLGIDSIKRVEILGALQERFPDAPNPNPEDLIELLTLGQIIDAMQELAQKKSSHLSLANP